MSTLDFLSKPHALITQLKRIDHIEILFFKDKKENKLNKELLDVYKKEINHIHKLVNFDIKGANLDNHTVTENLEDLKLILAKIERFHSRFEKWDKKLGIKQETQTTSRHPLQIVDLEMKEIAEHFKKGNKQQAFQMLKGYIQKYPSLRQEIGKYHWEIIEQKQIWGYGEKAFFDEEGHTSPDDKKAATLLKCISFVQNLVAQEISKTESSLKQEQKQLIPVQIPSFLSPEPTLADQMKQIAQKFTEGKKEEAIKECIALCNKFPRLYGLIGGEHWKLIEQKNIWGYGEKAFFEWDNCSSPCDKKAQALLACIPLIQDAPSQAQKLIDNLKIYWNQINGEQIPGQQKHQKKMESIHQATVELLKLIDRGNAVEQFQRDTSCQQMTPLIHFYKNKYSPLIPYLGQLIREMDRKTGCAPNLDPNDVNAQKEYRAKVFKESTINCLQAGYYVSPNGTKHDLTKDIHEGRKGLKLYKDGGNIKQHVGDYDTKLITDSRDCMKLALMYKKMGCNPVLLDMAANDKPLGDPYKGARAQEEDLSRRSTLAAILDPQYQHQNDQLYPLDQKVGPVGGIYLSNVKIFADGYESGYQFLDQPESVAVIVSAAIRKPTLNNDLSYQDPQVYNTMKEKIRTQLKMAYDQGHDTVILSAFGCGAFSNPPHLIADIYRQVIEKEYPHCFKYIVFSVVDDHNTGHAHNPEGNFKPFAEMVKKNGGIVCKF